MRLPLVMICGLLTLPAMAGVASSRADSKEPPIEVSVRLLGTAVNGATQVRATAGTHLGIGGSSRLYVGFGALQHGLCGGRSGGVPMGRFGSEKMLAEVEDDLGSGTEDRHLWVVDIQRRAAGDELTALTISWNRSAANGEPDVDARRVDVTLDLGERRVLEVVPVSSLGDDPTCQVESLQIEIEVAPVAHPAMAHRDLVCELWLAVRRDGRREEFAAAELLTAQAEKLDFTLPALRHRLPGFGGADDVPTIRVQLKGALRAWSIDSDRVAVTVEPRLHHRLDGAATSGWSGRGEKRFQARLGETVALTIPTPTKAVISAPIERFELPGRPVEGIELSGDSVRLDVGRLLGDLDYSLLIRVRAAD